LLLFSHLLVSIMTKCQNDQSAKTGSGQTQGKRISKKAAIIIRSLQLSLLAAFPLLVFVCQKRSFYQDRLGTDRVENS
jgi:hypothetical protein